MTFDEYQLEVVMEKDCHPDWRMGQTAFNILHRFRPDLSEQVRGNYELDPFYFDGRLSDFYEWVAVKW